MFLDIRLPEDISYGAVGGPRFSTNVITLSNGFEQRNINWLYPKHYYSISYDFLSQSMMDYMLNFFHTTSGRAHSFRFKDWNDFTAQKSQLKLIIAEQNEWKFQLFKMYNTQSEVVARKITKIVPGTLKISDKDGKEVSGYSVDYNSGTVTFSSYPGETLFADFEFDVQVRFDSDQCDIMLNKPKVYSWKSIKLIEVDEVS
jgi:uncharacterized protein (TIGR02217 family)